MFKFAGKALSLTAASLMVTTAISSAQSLAELVAAAKAEGPCSPPSPCRTTGAATAT